MSFASRNRYFSLFEFWNIVISLAVAFVVSPFILMALPEHFYHSDLLRPLVELVGSIRDYDGNRNFNEKWIITITGFLWVINIFLGKYFRRIYLLKKKK